MATSARSPGLHEQIMDFLFNGLLPQKAVPHRPLESQVLEIMRIDVTHAQQRALGQGTPSATSLVSPLLTPTSTSSLSCRPS